MQLQFTGAPGQEAGYVKGRRISADAGKGLTDIGNAGRISAIRGTWTRCRTR